jgi:isopenicillin N synthase-like dioxygenase
MKVSKSKSKYFNGYNGSRTTNISPGESVDVKESLGWRYSPQYDPDPKDLDAIPEEVKPWIRGEDFVWEETSHLPAFKDQVLAYWAACLTLARKLVKVFALSLDLAEDYFDSRTTYPGADGVFNVRIFRSFLPHLDCLRGCEDISTLETLLESLEFRFHLLKPLKRIDANSDMLNSTT